MAQYFGGYREPQSNTLWLFLGLNLFCCIFFCLFAYSFLAPSAPVAARATVERIPAPELLEVLVPLHTIVPGSKLQRADFKIEQRPAVDVVAGTIRKFDEVLGHYARTAIVKDVPLHAEHLTDIRPQSLVSPRIPPGFRAVSIRVNATSSVEGWSMPGSKVDVHLAHQLRGRPAVTLIVQNAEVLSVEGVVQQPDLNAMAQQEKRTYPNTVTLLVSARDAQKIQLANTIGTMSLSLRGDSDTGKADSGGTIDEDEVLGMRKASLMPPAATGTLIENGTKWLILANGERQLFNKSVFAEE